MGGYNRWDTPTDGISRKQFDRAMDGHIRRYVTAMEAIRALEIQVAKLTVGYSHLEKEELEQD